MIILLFGATGAAGGGVLRACLDHPDVTEVRAITRRAPAQQGAKLRVIEHRDFLDYAAVADAFDGVDACLFCLGISATQVTEEEYRRITHDFAIAAARTLRERSPGASFHYISGGGTRLDSRFMWARVKAETERELIGEFGAVCWRPAAIDGEPSASLAWQYKVLRPLVRLLKPFRSFYIDAKDIGLAMSAAAQEGMRGRIFENREIRDIADRARAAAVGGRGAE